MLTLTLGAFMTFLATEMDDFALFVILFAQYKNNKAAVFWGHMIMMIIITVLCAFVSVPLSKIPEEYLRFLGIIPFCLGVIYIIKSIRNKDDDEEELEKFKGTGIFVSSMLITLTASGDNVGVYIPAFIEFDVWEKIYILGIFVLLQCLWSFLQIKTAAIPAILKIVEKTSAVLIPAILMILGLLVFFT